MINNIKKLLNTNIVLLNERQKRFILNILKSNIFIFFTFGIILTILSLFCTNWNTYFSRNNKYLILHIQCTLSNFIPFFIAIIINLVIRFSKNEIVKKIFKIIMIITNILSGIYIFLLLSLGIICCLDNPNPYPYLD